MCVTEVYNYGS